MVCPFQVQRESGLTMDWPPTAQVIKAALAKHHTKDVFVDECKNGPTWSSTGLSQLDAWALLRTWSPLTAIGYEVKVSRADFEKDQKWPQYLPLCHAFYFVCPAGLIKSVDLPKGIGLKYITKSGTIHTKLRAERHEPDADKFTLLLAYVVMCRTQIVKDTMKPPTPDRLTLIREWVKTADAKKELALVVTNHLRVRFEDMQKQVKEAEYMKNQAHKFAEELAMLGITWNPNDNTWSHNSEVSQQIRQLRADTMDTWDLQGIASLGKHMAEFAERMIKLREKLKSEVEL